MTGCTINIYLFLVSLKFKPPNSGVILYTKSFYIRNRLRADNIRQSFSLQKSYCKCQLNLFLFIYFEQCAFLAGYLCVHISVCTLQFIDLPFGIWLFVSLSTASTDAAPMRARLLCNYILIFRKRRTILLLGVPKRT